MVDDYEVEVDVPPPQSHGNVVTDQGTAIQPLGRGRGSTLPLWMTQSSSSKRDDRSHSSSSSTDHHRRRKKKHRKKDDKKKKRKHHKYDDDYRIIFWN